MQHFYISTEILRLSWW